MRDKSWSFSVWCKRIGIGATFARVVELFKINFGIFSSDVSAVFIRANLTYASDGVKQGNNDVKYDRFSARGAHDVLRDTE